MKPFVAPGTADFPWASAGSASECCLPDASDPRTEMANLFREIVLALSDVDRKPSESDITRRELSPHHYIDKIALPRFRTAGDSEVVHEAVTLRAAVAIDTIDFEPTGILAQAGWLFYELCG